jgi:hypothetical protein
MRITWRGVAAFLLFLIGFPIAYLAGMAVLVARILNGISEFVRRRFCGLCGIDED